MWESVIVLCFVIRSSIAIILMGNTELIALLNLSSWCLVVVERFFLVVPPGCLRFVIVVFSDHTHLLFFMAVVHEFYVKTCFFRHLYLFQTTFERACIQLEVAD